MQNRSSTDIDRKLAIYYHPLFQQILRAILNLFQGPSHQVGLLQFVQFNLKLQKCLLPSFQVENALVSALNDWVKEVAECMSFQGMVSTSHCQKIDSDNFQSIFTKEYSAMRLTPFTSHSHYFTLVSRFAAHDAFKLLNVRINKEVFNKFMFDLCSTWCQFLDIQLFSYFLIGIFMQVSSGQDIQGSRLKETMEIQTIELSFMEQFQELKLKYNKKKKKQLRYYRAWCEWNYLRINDVGEALILHLNGYHSEDARVVQLANLFQRAIQTINEEITTQNKVEITEIKQQPVKEGLLIKKLEVKQKSQPINSFPQTEYPQEQYYDPPHEFEIEIDAEGNMFLKKIVRLPIVGSKAPVSDKRSIVQDRIKYLQNKRDSCREVSNLYRRGPQMKVRLEHNAKNDYYSYKHNAKILARDAFYGKKAPMQIDKAIHGKIKNGGKDQEEQQQQEQEEKIIKYATNPPPQVQPLRMLKNYKHKVMAPSFLTDNAHNISYMKGDNYVYGSSVHSQKRNLQLNLPKLKYFAPVIQPKESYQVIGKVGTRQMIKERVKAYSSVAPVIVNKLQQSKQQYKHIWSRYIDDEQMKELTNYNKFYQRLEQAKEQFGQDHKSEFRKNLIEGNVYKNSRAEMGGVLTEKDQEKFYTKMEKLIKKQRNSKKNKKKKFKAYKRVFKSKKDRMEYESIFINSHKQAIKSINQQKMMQTK